MINNIIATLKSLIKFVIIYMPNPLGTKIRYLYYGRKFKSMGKNVRIDEGVIIEGAEWISVGDNVWIDRYCVLLAGQLDLLGRVCKVKKNRDFVWEEGELIIGNDIHVATGCIIQAYGGFYIGDHGGLGPGTKIYSLTTLASDPYDPQRITNLNSKSDNTVVYHKAPIVMHRNAGVAINSILMPGVTLGENSFVGINSVAIGTVKPNYFVSGNPAKKVKERFNLSSEKE